jgi:hypothetical protein
MSAVPTGFANDSTPCYLKMTGFPPLIGNINQLNSGVITTLYLTTPIVLAAPFAPGGTAVAMNLALEPVGASPHGSVALRLNFYDATGALIGVQDIV